MANDTDKILDHYRKEAHEWGDSASSTMRDETTRKKEVDKIIHIVEGIIAKHERVISIADIGCGNGVTIEKLSRKYPNNHYIGLDFTLELLAIAKERNVPHCKWMHASVLDTPLDSESCDIVYTERCLINLLDDDEKMRACQEIYRILKPGGHYLMIESFQEGLVNLNRARNEMGLDCIEAPSHNKYWTVDLLKKVLEGRFTAYKPYALCEKDAHLSGDNFLSSHYFMARVVHPCLSKGSKIHKIQCDQLSD